MEKVSFEFLGLTLLEPLSTLMNWVLAAQCFLFYQKLKKLSADGSFIKYWSWFFLAYAISLVFGGFSHLLYEYTGLYGKIPGWSAAIIGVAFGELAMVSGLSDEKRKATLLAIIRGKLFASFALLGYDFSFKWVMVQTIGLFLFVGIIGYQRWKSGIPGYRYFFFGIGCLLLMALVKVLEIDIHPAWFNRDDIAHFIMLVAYWLFYKSVRKVSLSA